MHERRSPLDAAAHAVPPQAWFAVSAVFHYLGPAFAVLLFAEVGVLGVAWLRIASAAAIFAAWTRPWRLLRAADPPTLRLLVALGACLACMNTSFYLALQRLPMGLVAAIEFVGTIALAVHGARTLRNLAALALAVGGVLLLVDLRWTTDRVGLAWAALNGVLWVAYVVLGHRVAARGASGGVERLSAAMSVALVCVMPIGIAQAAKALGTPRLLLAGIGVGLCSSVIPYVCDQLAMSRLPRASFALMSTLMPAMATLMGALVLAQIPGLKDLAGIALVMAGVGLHRPASPIEESVEPQTTEVSWTT
jgi:inner membrane transporter RhtA